MIFHREKREEPIPEDDRNLYIAIGAEVVGVITFIVTLILNVGIYGLIACTLCSLADLLFIQKHLRKEKTALAVAFKVCGYATFGLCLALFLALAIYSALV